jgi:peptidoglycan/LPS O-acetylase OafA/YrhL
VRLSDAYAGGRDNNFNLIRVIAALAVLVAHSWPLALGSGFSDPLAATGIGLGPIAVDVFFVTSGFLVTASLLQRGNAADFVVARVLRIYPALVVAVIACVALGLAFTRLPAADFLTDPLTLKFLWKNAVAIRGGEYYLPGVFEANPFPKAVNGSLWTLLWELRMYMILVALWWLAGLTRDRRRSAFAASVVLLAVVTTALYFFNRIAPGQLHKTLLVKNTLVPGFLVGGAFYVLRKHVVLNAGLFACATAAVFATGFWLGGTALQAVYFLALPYLVLFLAYVPGGALRRFNQLGDYSYGIYIFAFPVQQTIAALVPGVSVGAMIASATAITVVIAWCSWHFIENPALLRRGAVSLALRGWLKRVSEQRPALDPAGG